MPDITIAVKDTYDGSQLSRLKQDLRDVLALQRQLATTSHGMPHGMPQTGAVGAAAVANGRLSNAPAPGGSPVSPVANQVNAQVAASGGAARLAAQQANISPTLPQQMQAQQAYGGGSYYPQMIVGGALQRAGSMALGETSENLGAYGRAQLARVGVETLEGANAPRVIEQAREEAKNTFGADYNDILGFQNQLVNQGTSREDAQHLVKSIGDINASMGGSSAILQRVMYNLSQVESQGRLTGLDNRQFQQARVNLNPYLAKQMGVEVSEVRERISNGDVTSEMVRKAIYAMGNDPKFKDRGRIITDTTLPGQFEKTKDEFNELRELMGEGLAPTVGKLNEGLRATIELMKKNPALAKGAGLTAGAVGVAAGIAGTAFVTRATLGMFGSMFPALQGTKGTGIQNFLFGGGRGTSPANPLFVMPVGGGLGGGLSGATGAAARAGAAPAGAGAGAARLAGLTVRGAMGAGALGLVGAVQQHGDMKAIGASGGAAFASAATVGIGEGLIAAFVPGGAVAVAIAEGLRFGVNELYNKPMENAPENNPDAPLNPASDSKKSFAERAELYQTQAGEMAARRNELAEPGMLENVLNAAPRLPFVGGAVGLAGVGFSAALKASREAAADNEGVGLLDSRMAAANAAGMRRHINREQNPDQLTISSRAEAAFRANPLNFNQGPGLLVTNAKNIEVGKVQHGDNYTSTITLTIPTHPSVRRVTQAVEQATRN